MNSLSTVNIPHIPGQTGGIARHCLMASDSSVSSVIEPAMEIGFATFLFLRRK